MSNWLTYSTSKLALMLRAGTCIGMAMLFAAVSLPAISQTDSTAGEPAPPPAVNEQAPVAPPTQIRHEAATSAGQSTAGDTARLHPEGAKVAKESANPPVAVDMDLSQPVELPEAGATGDASTSPPAPPAPAAASASQRPPLMLLGSEVAAGTSTRLSWSPEHSFAGIAAPTPVLVVNGKKPGPVLCLTAAIHGDELNGIEVVRRVLYELDAKKLSGTVIGVPIVNLQGFRRGSRYMPDRRDLNRFFPGNPRGSSAARIAESFFTEVISHCSALVDLHTGSFHRTNLPQLRADLENPQVLKLTQGFGSTVVLHSPGAEGTLRRAASDAGIPAVTLEAGEPARVQAKAVSHGTKGVMTLLNELGMYKKITMWGHREPVYYRSTWVRADRGGVLFSEVALGERVTLDQVLGTITDPITNVQSEVRATASGRVLGMAVNQFVMPGFAAFRIGIAAPDGGVPKTPAVSEMPDEELAAVPEVNEAADDGEADEDSLLDERDGLEDSE